MIKDDTEPAESPKLLLPPKRLSGPMWRMVDRIALLRVMEGRVHVYTEKARMLKLKKDGGGRRSDGEFHFQIDNGG